MGANNKLDLIEASERATRLSALLKKMRWKGRVFTISGATGEGCTELVEALGHRLFEASTAA